MLLIPELKFQVICQKKITIMQATKKDVIVKKLFVEKNIVNVKQ